MRMAMFDIETTALEGSYGRFLCACMKFLDEKTIRTVEAPSQRNERRALKELADHLEDAHVIVTWNGKMFDWRYVNQRRMVLGMPALPKKMHLDWYHVHRHHCRSRGHKQMYVAADLGCEAVKFEPGAAAWVAAADGDPKAFRKIVKHCQKDVLQLEEIHWRLAELCIRINK